MTFFLPKANHFSRKLSFFALLKMLVIMNFYAILLVLRINIYLIY